jgi:uncharacterized coiled-coil DUF342 family protein
MIKRAGLYGGSPALRGRGKKMELSSYEVADLKQKAQTLEAALETEDLSPEEEAALLREKAGEFLTAFQIVVEVKAAANRAATRDYIMQLSDAMMNDDDEIPF